MKAGARAEVVGVPGLEVVIERVKTVKRTVRNKTTHKDEELPFTIGVECHWIDKNFTFQKGILHTSELRAIASFPNIKKIPLNGTDH